MKLLDKKALIPLILGTFLGSGSVWQFMNVSIQREQTTLQKLNTSSEIRKQLIELQTSILESTAIYYQKWPTERQDAIREKTKIDFMITAFRDLEKSLAEIEERPPKMVQLDFLKPDPPTNLRRRPVEFKQR